MGAQTFEEIGYGATPQEAFQRAHQEACHEYGHGGYTGSLAEKHDFTIIPVPKGMKPSEYADYLIDQDDSRIRDKWGPAGCILLEEGHTTINDPEVKKAKVNNVPAQGTKKWETLYVLYASGTEVRGGQKKSKTDALKMAKDVSIRLKTTVEIKVEKRLVGESNVVAVIEPEVKMIPRKVPNNKYLFFGWASS